MKKILLATTALVGFAGAAAAEVALTGYAEIGVAGGNGGVETQFWNDIDV
ncbi:MAG TPA: porin, partial [Paracoccaceae bacterium]